MTFFGYTFRPAFMHKLGYGTRHDSRLSACGQLAGHWLVNVLANAKFPGKVLSTTAVDIWRLRFVSFLTYLPVVWYLVSSTLRRL